MDEDLSLAQWPRVSRTLDYIFAQQPTKIIKESPGAVGIRGEPEKPKRKPEKEKEKPQGVEQLRMF